MKRQAVPNSRIKSAEIIGDNDEILINILVHLPEESLLRFRKVSKHWCSLISSPYFSRCLEASKFSSALFLRQRPYSNKPKYHFLSLDGKPVSDPLIKSLTFVDDPAGIRILQSCNGLLLCRSNSLTLERNHNYYIYNPATNEYITLPKPCSRIPNTIFGVALAFDPSKSPHYKVVFVRSLECSQDQYQLEIYSSETHLWTFSGGFHRANYEYNQGVFSCGAIHWRSNSGACLSFNVDEERFQEIPTPKIPDHWQADCRYFGESGGRLHIILTNGRHSTSQFDVYEMEYDFSGWSVKHRVDLNELISEYPEMTPSNSNQSDRDYHAFRVLAVFCKENESFMVLHIPGKAISYNFKDKTSTLLHDFAPGCTDIDGCTIFEPHDAYPYVGTFASLCT